MRRATVVGLIAGGVVAGLAAGSVALAAGRKPEDQPFCEYQVRAGDTLSALGLRFFGDAKKWPLMTTKSGKALTESLPVDTVLLIPCKWHKVKHGETLAKIAQEELADGGRWKRIAELNRPRLQDPDRLEVGSVLAIPLDNTTAAPPSAKIPETIAIGGLDLLGEDEIVFVGKGGGGGHGGGHGGPGGHGRGRGGWGWGGGPYFWGPWYSDGIDVDELDAPTAEEVAAELAKHLKGHAS